ncbi:hypothetical protein BG011_009362 [Mortierella polycephala]|uniref:Arsenate reductase n=1 Tax=Mortierella polycephala TaxID=41804 RepID=A0A9P6U7Q1_9FUNG|nr:hypothetical protein BG011_009362 [Mortierella polycephala]
MNLTKIPRITIFHNPSCKISIEALKLLKKASNANKFRITLIQAKYIPPTQEEIARMVEWLGEGSIDQGIKEILVPEAPVASTVHEVQKILSEKPMFLKKPLLVNWNESKAIIAIIL